MGPAEAEPWRRCRSTRVEEMGEALPVLCGRDARAPGWASSHDAGISRSRYRRCIRAPLVIEGGPSLFVFIRVHLWFVFKNDRQFLPRMIRPPRRGPSLSETNEKRQKKKSYPRTATKGLEKTRKGSVKGYENSAAATWYTSAHWEGWLNRFRPHEGSYRTVEG